MVSATGVALLTASALIWLTSPVVAAPARLRLAKPALPVDAAQQLNGAAL
jgi:hypothetical protein